MRRRMLGGLCGVVGGWTAARGVATPTGRVAAARARGGRRCRRWAKLGPKQKQARRLDGPHGWEASWAGKTKYLIWKRNTSSENEITPLKTKYLLWKQNTSSENEIPPLKMKYLLWKRNNWVETRTTNEILLF
jgi:hypothetical protein